MDITPLDITREHNFTRLRLHFERICLGRAIVNDQARMLFTQEFPLEWFVCRKHREVAGIIQALVKNWIPVDADVVRHHIEHRNKLGVGVKDYYWVDPDVVEELCDAWEWVGLYGEECAEMTGGNDG